MQDTNFNFKGVVKGVEVLPQSVINAIFLEAEESWSRETLGKAVEKSPKKT